MNLLVANWKMNLDLSAAKNLACEFANIQKTIKSTQIWVTPAFNALSSTKQALSGSGIKLGAQNVHWEKQGAFTGEVSVGMLKELGCEFSLVGHSERRHVFGESIELVTKRALGALTQGFSIIFCVGETLDERSQGKTLKVLEHQLKPLVDQLKPQFKSNLLLAYEPVWAIGTGKVAELSDIKLAHNFLEGLCPNTPILYGGSISPDNFAGIISLDEVSGGLVGGASLSKEKFEALARISEGVS